MCERPGRGHAPKGGGQKLSTVPAESDAQVSREKSRNWEFCRGASGLGGTMSTQKYRIRLTPQLTAQLTDLGEAWGVGLATLIRLASMDLLQHPERVPTLVATYLGV